MIWRNRSCPSFATGSASTCVCSSGVNWRLVPQWNLAEGRVRQGMQPHAAIRSRSRWGSARYVSQAVAKLVFGCAYASLASRIIPLAIYPEALLPKTESRAKGAGQNRVVEAGGGPRYKASDCKLQPARPPVSTVVDDAIRQAIQHPQTWSCVPPLPHKRHT